MKTSIYLVAAIVATLASGCQKADVLNDVRQEISFSAEVGKRTKAPINGTTYPDDVPFGVFAYGLTDGSNWSASSPITNQVMNKVDVSKTGGIWKATSELYYWPNNADSRLSFFAYSPKTLTSSNVDPTFTAADGITFTDYVNDGTTDLMYGATKDQKSGSVVLTFNHAMTQVKFTVVKPSTGFDKVNITVKSIKLKDIINKGTFKAETQVWTPSAIGSDVQAYEIYNKGTGQVVTTSAAAIGIPMVMIPQEASLKYFEVVYDVAGTGVASETVTKTISLTDWSPNQKVSYNLTFSMDAITFTPSVSDWNSPQNEEAKEV